MAIFLKQPASTWSKSTIGAPTKCVKHFSNLTIKASKWYHSRRFVVFIINFEQIPFLSLNKKMLKGKVFYRYLQLAKNFCIYIQQEEVFVTIDLKIYLYQLGMMIAFPCWASRCNARWKPNFINIKVLWQ